jgi:hypothetical protein
MKSEKQLEAARLNGAKSKGPITPEGKANSSRNAITHGLLTTSVLLVGESRERFLDLLAEFTELYKPRNITERSLVETMAMARWRTIRLWTFGKWTLDGGVAVGDRETATGSIPFETTMSFSTTATARPDLILRDETMYHSQFHRCLKQLQALQSRPSPDTHPTEQTQEPIENTSAQPCGAGWQPAADCLRAEARRAKEWQSALPGFTEPGVQPDPPLPFPPQPVKISVATESRGPQTGRGA